MSEQPTEIERKLIEFATKTAETIQSQAGQIQAITHTLLIALISMSEQEPEFKKDFIKRIEQVRDQMSERPIDKFTSEFFEELVPFLKDPYHYSADDKPRWFKGIIDGGKLSPEDKETD